MSRISSILLVSFLLISSLSNAQTKAFDEYLMDKVFEQPPLTTAVPQPSGTIDLTISINTSKEIASIRQSLFGQNSVGYQGNRLEGSRQETNWKNGNFTLLRYPGGNWSNKWFWDGNVPASIKTSTTVEMADLLDGTASWMLETDEYPAFINDMGADGLVCVNAGYAFYGNTADPVTTAAEYAAGWVEEYNVNLNAGVKYWEIGNENYGPWQAGFDLGSAEDYANACLVFIEKMKAVDSTIKVGVVLYEGYGGFNSTPQGINWNETILPITQHVADFYIIHHYPHPNTNQNDIAESDIYDAIHVVQETHDMMNDLTETYTDYEAGHFPIAMTEFNARAGVRNLSRCNALFTTLMLCEYAKYDYEAATQWDLVNGYTVDGGDHGLVSRRDPFLQTGSVNPEFYAFYYMGKYLGDRMVGSASTDSDVETYATTFSSGELGLVIVNTGDVDKTIEVDIAGYNTGDNMYWHTVYGDESDFDRTVYINGVGPDTTFTPGVTYTSNMGSNEKSQQATEFEANGVSGPQNYEEVLANASTLTSGINPKIEVNRYSVTYIVFEGSTNGCSVPDLGDDVTLCEATSVLLETGISNEAVTYLWDKDGVGFSAGTSHETGQAAVYGVTVTADGCEPTSDQIMVSSELAVVLNDTVCSIEDQALLTVLSSGSHSWYDAAKDGNLLSSENTFEPFVSETTTYYVEADLTQTHHVGKPDQDGAVWGNTAAGVYEQTDRKITVTVGQDLTLISFDVFVNTQGTNAVVNITGSNYAETWNFDELASGRTTFTINAMLQPGTYTLDLIGTVGGIYFQNENGGDRDLQGIISFAPEPGWASAYYGMFYDWVVATNSGCVPTPVLVVVDSNHQDCLVTVVTNVQVADPEVYPNPTSGLVNWKKSSPYSLYNIAGELILTGNGTTLDFSTHPNGLYLLKMGDDQVRLLKE